MESPGRVDYPQSCSIYIVEYPQSLAAEGAESDCSPSNIWSREAALCLSTLANDASTGSAGGSAAGITAGAAAA